MLHAYLQKVKSKSPKSSTYMVLTFLIFIMVTNPRTNLGNRTFTDQLFMITNFLKVE